MTNSHSTCSLYECGVGGFGRLIFRTVIYIQREILKPWWRHQMETFSVSLALCAGSSPASGKFPSQRPVTGSFDVFFDLRLNKRLNKQWWGWWFDTPSRPIWRHCNDTLYMTLITPWFIILLPWIVNIFKYIIVYQSNLTLIRMSLNIVPVGRIDHELILSQVMYLCCQDKNSRRRMVLLDNNKLIHEYVHS